MSTGAWCASDDHYQHQYQASIADPDGYWGELAQQLLTWQRPFTATSACDLAAGRVAWFTGGQLNASVNCIDRHLPLRATQTALLWEGDEPGDNRHITYQELHDEVNRLANVLRRRGIGKGDRVAIYMPMIPEAVYALLACARIGAPHSVVFAGFSAESLADRIIDANCVAVITADGSRRGGKAIALKATVDAALTQCPHVGLVLVARHSHDPVAMIDGRDVWLDQAMAGERPYCPPAIIDSEDLLFLLYTSGSTGKPKGIAHSTAGYLL
ncbi:MAG: AMP-binding protein, partial [Planctomycetota bacterium]